jgi:hypothetical protein
MGKRILLGAMICALFLCLGTAGFAQESSVKGNLGGVVVDQTGAVIPGAKVTLSGPTGNSSATSDNEGNFTFSRLVPGSYAVKVEKEGFKATDVKNIEVAIGRTSSLRMQLAPGAASETVEVNANAVTIDTASTASGSDLSDTFYSKVPTQRNVSSLFYVAPGVTDSGGAGRANPSISGGSGLENLYIADGVNITDSAFGGLGVFTRNQGSVGTGINLTFIKEVQVKSGGFEPQYGQATGGVVQIVTKSGGSAYHGAIAGYASSRDMVAPRKNTDDFRQFNAGLLDNSSNYDVSGELGGYVPRFKEHLFFFGAYNPTWTFNYVTPPQFIDDGAVPLTDPSNLVGLRALRGNNPFVLRTFVNNYAGKLTYRLNDKHSVESSVFGDPSVNNQGPENLVLSAANDGGFSKWDYGTRNWVVRYNGTLTPTWLVNANFTWANNRFTETPLRDEYSITNGLTGTSLQGFGFKENHDANDFAYTVETNKVLNAFGQHTFLLGFNSQLLNYDNNRRRSGPGYVPPATNLAGGALSYPLCPGPNCPLNPGTLTDASFTLVDASTLGPGGTACTLCPIINGTPVALNQTRGQTGGNLTATEGLYYASYFNDSWQINKHFTISAGLRWEQFTMRGTAANYTFTDNWAPRLGFVVDPKGDRKSKFYANFGRYNYQMPLDAAIRSLSSETDLSGLYYQPVITNGVVSVVTDAAHVLNQAAGGVAKNPIVSQSGAGEAFSPGTKMQYEDEWIAGYERDMGRGVIFSARYVDRRLRRVVEDMSGMSPEGANIGLAQQFSIGNPSTTTDLFHNQKPHIFSGPTGPCTVFTDSQGNPINSAAGPLTDANGNPVTTQGICYDLDPNHLSAVIDSTAFGGDVGPDGIPDGFANPVRNYQAVEIEVNKGFSDGWLMRANYRIARLRGNYEGAFRNDNGQTDPSISSLFDFTTGVFNELGDQFAIGPLNTDRRNVVNGFFSYTFPKSALKALTLGTGIRVQSGTPISQFANHPVYTNSGEVPLGGRGALGRNPVSGQLDLQADYPWKINERSTMRFSAALFNISNSKPVLFVDQNRDLSGGTAGSNPDFLKPGNSNSGIGLLTGFQEPFRARFSVRWEF